MSGGSCYVGGETVPNTEDFVDSEGRNEKLTFVRIFYRQVVGHVLNNDDELPLVLGHTGHLLSIEVRPCTCT